MPATNDAQTKSLSRLFNKFDSQDVVQFLFIPGRLSPQDEQVQRVG